MRYPHPERWTDQLWRAGLTLLATAVALSLAWDFLRPLLGPLIVFAMLALIVRAAWGFRRRDEW